MRAMLNQKVNNHPQGTYTPLWGVSTLFQNDCQKKQVSADSEKICIQHLKQNVTSTCKVLIPLRC